MILHRANRMPERLHLQMQTDAVGRRRRWIPRRVGLALVALIGAVSLGGCASVRDDLGTVNSECYIAIPAALQAVHHHGTLRGVRLMTVDSLRRHAPLLYGAATRARKPVVSDVCLVAFGGRFSADGLPRPVGRTSGRLAVVELAYPSNRLLATLLATRAPLPFGHPHI